MPLDLTDAVLLPIDMQTGFDDPSWPPRWNSALDSNTASILAAWRRAGRPIVHVRHDSAEPASTLRPGALGNAFRASSLPHQGEQVMSKSVNSAFIGTDLDLRLRRLGARSVIAFGLSTDQCVSTTIRTGANMGWKMTLIADACDCFALPGPDVTTIPARTVHDVHVATLAFEFCTVASTAEVLEAIADRR